jgi:hypothetical protein
MPAAHVTFVVATHRRVDALRCTLHALLLQTHADWTALVIGDHCGAETGEAIRGLRDSRIRYYNLPERFGEQSGPNTAGLHLAGGEFVSFLNHDDLPLPDHLRHAVDQLDARRADFYIGRFANATRLVQGDGGALVPVFTEILPRHRTLDVLVSDDPWCFDPSSFWVIRTSYAKTVGAWRPAVTLWRTPLRDWLMRAWRLRGVFCFGDRVTGLRFWTQNVRETLLYEHATPEHEYMLERMRSLSPDAIRALIEEQIAHGPDLPGSAPAGLSSEGAGWGGHRRAVERSRRMLRRFLYLQLGLDLVSLTGRLARRPRGGQLAWISRKRTGEALPERPTIDAFLRDPEAHRVL